MLNKPKKVFLTNKELLAAIHENKIKFCSYLEPQYQNYDAIVSDIKEITPEFRDAVRAKKARPRGGEKVEPSTIDPTTLVYRVMTYEHIPREDGRDLRRARGAGKDYVKLPFPPFKHYVFLEDGPKEVARSHWKGGFENGYFEANGSQLTDKLGRMLMLMAKRYGNRPNLRYYSYLEDMVSAVTLQLCGTALQFDESKGAIPNPFAFYTTIIKNAFTRFLNQESRQQDIRDDMLEEMGALPSYSRQNAERT